MIHDAYFGDNAILVIGIVSPFISVDNFPERNISHPQLRVDRFLLLFDLRGIGFRFQLKQMQCTSLLEALLCKYEQENTYMNASTLEDKTLKS